MYVLAARKDPLFLSVKSLRVFENIYQEKLNYDRVEIYYEATNTYSEFLQIKSRLYIISAWIDLQGAAKSSFDSSISRFFYPITIFLIKIYNPLRD